MPGAPQVWLARASNDLALARATLPPGAAYEDLCFHAQQAVEKALKAVYLARHAGFRLVHDVEALIAGLREQGVDVPPDIDAAARPVAHAPGSCPLPRAQKSLPISPSPHLLVSPPTRVWQGGRSCYTDSWFPSS
ncbi:MAG: HEPN domain-containing protein [Planctomycetes bacterium]|nr:HEPN domain-containing protein [Planctomycetota bacterium]